MRGRAESRVDFHEMVGHGSRVYNRPVRACLALFAVALCTACGDDSATTTHATGPAAHPPSAPSEPRPASAAPDRHGPGQTAPFDDLADIDDTPEPVPPGGAPATDDVALLVDATAPPHGCIAVTRAPLRIWSRGGPADVVALPTGFVVAGYAPGEQGGEEVFVVRVPTGHAPTPFTRFTIEVPAAAGLRDGPPGLADRSMAQVLLALTDGHGAVLTAALPIASTGARPTLTTIADGADLRFAPAVVVAHGVAGVAFTDGRSTPMRVRLATLRDDLGASSVRDLTPAAMGASAPVAFAGADTPSLLFLDAHGGLSPILRVALGDDGAPAPATVERPLSTVSQPAHIAVAAVGGSTWVAYTAVGRAATSAVGLVRLGSEAPPVALVPGTGYGRLHVDAVNAGRTAVFAADRPVAGAATTDAIKTDVVVRVLDEAGLGPPLVVAELSSQRAGSPALARAADGTIAVAFTGPSGVYLSLIRCAD